MPCTSTASALFVELGAAGVNDKGRLAIERGIPCGAVRGPVADHERARPGDGSGDDPGDRQDFGQSAANMRVAGADGVEVHGPTAISACSSSRRTSTGDTDEYGGRSSARAAFLIESGEAIRARVGDAITVGLRPHHDEFIARRASTPELADEAVAVLSATGSLGLLLDLVGGYHALRLVDPVSMREHEEGFLIRTRAGEADRRRSRAVFVSGEDPPLRAGRRGGSPRARPTSSR